MAGRLDGRTALVTGAGDGIGAGVARRLAAEGAAVAVCDIAAENAQRTVGQIEEAGGRAIACAADVADRAQIDAATAAAAELGGGELTILVCVAGIVRAAMFPKMEGGQWDSVIAVHLSGTFHCAQSALAYMPDDGRGRIITVTSAAGQVGTIGQVNYSSAKSGIIGLTKSMARELAPKRQITANVVSPMAATAMTEKIRTDERFKDKTLARIPLGRWADPDEIAGTFAFLASDDAAYITGQVINIDGGTVMGG